MLNEDYKRHICGIPKPPEEKYREVREEVLRDFSPTMRDLINVDALSKSVFESLIRGTSPYKLLEQLLIINLENTKRLEEMGDQVRMKVPIQYVVKLNKKEYDNARENFGEQVIPHRDTDNNNRSI